MNPLQQVVGYEDWMMQTSRTLLRRSEELKKVDAALQTYQRSPSYPALLALKQAFNAWKLAHGNGNEWRDSARNTNQYATLLDNQLKGIGDTDIGLGAHAFMEPALINTRLGVLYLYSKLDCNDMFKVILEGALDLTTASLEFADVDEKIGTGLEAAKGKAGNVASFVEGKIRQREGQAKPVSSGQLLDTNLPPPPGKLRAIMGQDPREALRGRPEAPRVRSGAVAETQGEMALGQGRSRRHGARDRADDTAQALRLPRHPRAGQPRRLSSARGSTSPRAS